jgi:amidase/6-aminohexanoate-cyclic-dimer hydrolase
MPRDATDLAAAISSRQISADEALTRALDAATRLNPDLSAVVLMQPDTARAHIAKGLPQGPFRGVPFLLRG